MSGNHYFVSFIDECSRFNRIFFIKHKSDVFNCFRTFVEEAERQSGLKVCILKSDRGGEYRSVRFAAFAASRGIILQQGPRKTPQHNSIAERFNQTIMEKTRAQMIHANLPFCLWGEISMATSHVMNLTPTSSTDSLPFQKWHEQCNWSGAHSADLDFLRVLGCAAFVHKPKDERRKLDPTATPMIHVGYENHAKAYCLWNPSTRKITVSRDVTFVESLFPLRTRTSRQVAPIEDDEDWWLMQSEIHTDPASDSTATADPATSSNSPSGPDPPTQNTRPVRD